MTIASSVAFAVDVDPLRLELTIPADQPSRSTLTITNSGAKTVNVNVRPAPYRFWQTDSTRPPSAETWFTFEPSGALTLAPGASQKITCIVTPPPTLQKDAHAEYVAALLIDELPAEEEQPSEKGAQITVVPRFALPVYLQIQGRQQVLAEISRFEIHAAASGGLLRADIELQNKGTIHLRPLGTILFFHQTSDVVVRASPVGKALPIFPATGLQIPVVVPMPSPGHYKAVVTLNLGQNKILQKEAAFEVLQDGTVH